ncbi:putative MFS family arabinose efflux permease [Streptosporangium album]|uniref:Putative MFS family arabinose efflux permease n=1 Tax=Streptosporangium album TaxID=47479 RepID=A0A7W7W6N0_9ACTN|nr:MFS transporter [Streptosporangium album]MBB4936432.1 putative MFS family arabinose efflux permease [Streptosporangium album]
MPRAVYMLAVQLSRPQVRGRAIAVVMNGLMAGTLLGLPLSTLIGEHLGWRAAFWAVSALTVLAALATMIGVPRLERAEGHGGGFRQEAAGFALLAHLSGPSVVFMLGIGLVGVTMNPAMVTRVQRTGNTGPPVNTVHSSFITLGVIIGSSAGGMAIDGFGLRAPLWLGAALATLGLLTLLPELVRRSAPVPSSDGPLTDMGSVTDGKKQAA